MTREELIDLCTPLAAISGGAMLAFATEREFVEWLSTGSPLPPGPVAFLLDAMVSWTTPGDDRALPDDMAASTAGFFLAGKRCVDRIREDPRYATAQIIVLTALDLEEVKGYGADAILGKGQDWDELLNMLTAAQNEA